MEIVPERAGGCENCKYRAMDETQEPCAHCTKNAVDNYEPMTNGDYIRSLGDADLAPIIMCPSEVGFDEIGFDEIVCQRGKQHCIECTRRWLEAERKVEEIGVWNMEEREAIAKLKATTDYRYSHYAYTNDTGKALEEQASEKRKSEKSMRIEAKKLIEEHPTVYDVDKVVEQLETEGSKIEIQYENNYEKGLLDGIGKAIEIVKEDGTDGR